MYQIKLIYEKYRAKSLKIKQINPANLGIKLKNQTKSMALVWYANVSEYSQNFLFLR